MADKPITITTPLKKDLDIHAMTGEEELGRLFEYHVEVVGDENKVEAAKLLGLPATVHLKLKEDKIRHFNGFICAFSHLGGEVNKAHYRLTLRPWLWFLSRHTDCRIFQNMTIPDIISKVFGEHGFTDFETVLSGNYGPWEYCVQYRESYFNFVSRLMEQEGIYYYFKHEEGKHTMVMTDSYSGHHPFPDYDTITYAEPNRKGPVPLDQISEWSATAQIQPGMVTLNDYDFEDPKKPLIASQPGPREHPPHADYEVYDYPGEYDLRSDGEEYARVRMQELSAQYEQIQGGGAARGIGVGYLFNLSGHHRKVENKEYLTVSAHYTLSNEAFETASQKEEPIYTCSFAAIDSHKPYRTPALTRKPIVYGAQTAKVVGKAGEEIWTEEYNRVKVQFYWDRYGKSDENSSCWVRVSQAWAGPNWGAIHIPRMGQEVIVDFLEGDPDKPLITGRVYNKDNMPPYPGKPTQSGIKSRSTKGATPNNFNELRFEDLKGEEHIYMQAEKDLITLVKHDETRDVKHDRKKTIGNDEITIVHGNRTETVDKNETITIHMNRKETVDKDESITIHGNRSEKVDKNEKVEIGGDQDETVTGKRTVTVTKDDNLSVTGNRYVKVAKEKHIDVDKLLKLTSKEKIILQTGMSTMTLSKDGTISIVGKKISIEGAMVSISAKPGAINIEAKGIARLSGVQVLLK